MSTGNFAGDVTFVNANQYYLETPHADKDGDKAAVFLDRDGDVTGAAGVVRRAQHPVPGHRRRARCAPNGTRTSAPSATWASACGATHEVVAPLTLTRDDAAALTLVGVPDHANSRARLDGAGRGLHDPVRRRRAAPAPALAEPHAWRVSGSGSRCRIPRPRSA